MGDPISDGFTPPLGRRLDQQARTCGYNPTMRDDAECGAPAAWHIIWTTDAENGFACEDCMARVRARWVYYCAHRLAAECGNPGSWVLFPPENRCIIPETDSPAGALAAAEKEPARA